MVQYPADFLWGVACASYQCEGAWNEDGKGPNIWDDFCHEHRGHHIKNGDSGDIACDAYHRFREDIALMKAHHIQAYRFSISWARVIPDGDGEINEKGLQYYSELVDELVDRFGDVPQPVDNLLNIALLKAMAHSVYVTQIVHRGEKTTIYMYERAKITAAAIPDLLEEYGRKLEFKPDPKQPRFIFRPEAKKDAVLLKQELKLVSDMSQRLTEKPGT